MKVFLLGTTDLSGKFIGGQLEKTKIIYNALMEDKDICLSFFNMFQFNNKIIILWKILMGYLCNDITIICLSENGAKKAITFIYHLKKIIKRKILFIVVGNQNNFIKKFDSKKIKCLDKCYFEIDDMRKDMSHYCNAGFFPNCKDIVQIIPQEKNMLFPIKICYYSEISPRKGFDKLIEVLKEINSNDIKFELDVFGFFADNSEAMKALISKNDFVSYKGTIKRDKTTEVLQKYLMMVFPSNHLNEGVPGVIIDAYEAGLPVLSSNVSYMSSIIQENFTGYIFQNKAELKKLLLDIYHEPQKVMNMCVNCLEEAKKYDTCYVYENFKRELMSILK